MPRITLNGKAPTPPRGPSAPPRGGKPTGPGQSFADSLANAIAQGNTIDPSLLGNAQFSPSYQSGAWRVAADRAAMERTIAAIQAVRRGGSSAAEAVQRAQQGFSTYRAAGGISSSAASMEAALQRVLRSAGQRPSGGALVPYQAAGLPAVYRSQARGFSLSGGSSTPDSRSTEVGKFLGQIATSTRQSARVETLAWDRSKQLLLAGPFTIPRPPGAWTNAGPQRPAFVPPGTPFPARPGGAPWAPAFVPPGQGGIPGAPGGGPGGPGNPPGPPRPPAPAPGPPGPGPGGGGGFGRARRGYGWGKAVSRIPYVGGAFSNVIEAGAIGGPYAAAAAAGVEAIDATAFNKQFYGDAVAGTVGRATPFIDLQRAAFGIGRAGGYSGRGTLSKFYNGEVPPPLLQAFGAQPQDAIRQLQQFGIVQGDPNANAAMFQALNVPQYTPGFSGLDQDAVRGSAGSAARYGAVDGRDAGSVTRYFNMMGSVMEGATARGMDRASILRSIDASVAGSALRGAAGVNAGAQADFIGRFANLPGGRTGELGLSAAATLDNAALSVGSAPTQSMAYALATKRYGTQGALEGLLGGKLTEGQQDTANLYFQALKAGDTPAAAKYLAALTQGNSNAISTILTGPGSPTSMVPGYRQPLAISGATGLGLNESVQLGAHPHSQIDSSGPMPPGESIGRVVKPGFEEKYVDKYQIGLARMGVRPDLIPMLIDEGRKAGINPLMAGATVMAESQGGYDEKAGANVMQVKGSSRLVGSGSAITSPLESIRKGYQVEKWALAQAHGDVRLAHNYYENGVDSLNWGSAANAGYENRLKRAYAQAGIGADMTVTDSNIPVAGNAVTSFGGAAMNRSSEQSMDNGATFIPYFNQHLYTAGAALDEFAKRVKKAQDSMDWYRAATHGGVGPLQ